MEIIKEGKIKEKTDPKYRIVCNNCGTDFIFKSSEMSSHVRGMVPADNTIVGDVICPFCNSLLVVCWKDEVKCDPYENENYSIDEFAKDLYASNIELSGIDFAFGCKDNESNFHKLAQKLIHLGYKKEKDND